MSEFVWAEAPLSKHHDRKNFDCGNHDLNLYLQRFARQNHESGGAKCFIAAPVDSPSQIIGFYTLSPASIEYSRTPSIIQKGLARYDVPVFCLGRLAVDTSVQSKGLGGALLLRAAERCIAVSKDVGGVALFIEAKSEGIAKWYESYGAVALVDATLSLLLPFRVVEEVMRKVKIL